MVDSAASTIAFSIESLKQKTVSTNKAFAGTLHQRSSTRLIVAARTFNRAGGRSALSRHSLGRTLRNGLLNLPPSRGEVNLAFLPQAGGNNIVLNYAIDIGAAVPLLTASSHARHWQIKSLPNGLMWRPAEARPQKGPDPPPPPLRNAPGNYGLKTTDNGGRVILSVDPGVRVFLTVKSFPSGRFLSSGQTFQAKSLISWMRCTTNKWLSI